MTLALYLHDHCDIFASPYIVSFIFSCTLFLYSFLAIAVQYGSIISIGVVQLRENILSLEEENRMKELQRLEELHPCAEEGSQEKDQRQLAEHHPMTRQCEKLDCRSEKHGQE